jgi:hypothetical protein
LRKIFAISAVKDFDFETPPNFNIISYHSQTAKVDGYGFKGTLKAERINVLKAVP